MNTADKITLVSKILAELGFTAASKDVTDENLHGYARWIVNAMNRDASTAELKNRVRLVANQLKVLGLI